MKKKILVVDDNRVLLNFIDRMLRKEGHEVAIAGDAFAALNILTDFVPDVMFIDFIMPTIDGDKLCRIVRKMRHMENCYIVFITAAAAELDFDYTKVGANACIAKGSFESVAGYIRDAIRDSDMPHRNSSPKAIMGLESVNVRQMTKELLLRHRHLQTILERMSQGILEIQSGKVVYANSAAIALFERSEEDIIASYPLDLFEESIRSEIEAIMNPENRLSEFENRGLDAELNGRQVLIECLPVGTEESTAILLITDVTHKKRLEAKFNEFRRLEAIGTLAGRVAHDINNLLMGIQGNTSLMLLEIEKNSTHFDSVKNIERCVKKGSKLTKELLGFARGGKYFVRDIDLNSLIEKNIYIFDDANRIIDINKEYQDDLWPIEADVKQIEQVLVTIFVNASQAIGTKRGEVSIKTENISLTKKFTEQFEVEEGDYVKLSLTDNGIGIDDSDKDRIFEPFFTTKEIAAGTGLGLAAAFGIIKNHCGIINFSSKKGQGTTFNIYLPAIPQN
jgi:signal transduction histidine kinase